MAMETTIYVTLECDCGCGATRDEDFNFSLSTNDGGTLCATYVAQRFEDAGWIDVGEESWDWRSPECQL